MITNAMFHNQTYDYKRDLDGFRLIYGTSALLRLTTTALLHAVRLETYATVRTAKNHTAPLGI